VVSFGTRADIVSGLDYLQQNQWEGIWPNIQDFKINLDSIHAGGDERIAWGVATWTSTGFHEDGTSFPRPGRATTILERRNGKWVSVHTHFSLNPGTPPRTYGRK
jgi:ketosteroid isomerase-like protein